MLSKVPSSLCSESSSESILLYFDSLLDFITGLDICYAAETGGAMVEIDIDYMWSVSTENDILVKSRCIFYCSIQVICGEQQAKNFDGRKRIRFLFAKRTNFFWVYSG